MMNSTNKEKKDSTLKALLTNDKTDGNSNSDSQITHETKLEDQRDDNVEIRTMKNLNESLNLCNYRTSDIERSVKSSKLTEEESSGSCKSDIYADKESVNKTCRSPSDNNDETDSQNKKPSQEYEKLQSVESVDVNQQRIVNDVSDSICAASKTVKGGGTSCSNNIANYCDKAEMMESITSDRTLETFGHIDSDKKTNVFEDLDSSSKRETAELNVCDSTDTEVVVPKRTAREECVSEIIVQDDKSVQQNDSDNFGNKKNSLDRDTEITKEGKNQKKKFGTVHDDKKVNRGDKCITSVEENETFSATHIKEFEVKNEVTKDKVKLVENDTQESKEKVVAIKPGASTSHVHFAEEPHKPKRACRPYCLLEVQEKLKEGGYESVVCIYCIQKVEIYW